MIEIETVALLRSTSTNNYPQLIYRIEPCLLGLHEKAVNVQTKEV